MELRKPRSNRVAGTADNVFKNLQDDYERVLY